MIRKLISEDPPKVKGTYPERTIKQLKHLTQSHGMVGMAGRINGTIIGIKTTDCTEPFVGLLTHRIDGFYSWVDIEDGENISAVVPAIFDSYDNAIKSGMKLFDAVYNCWSLYDIAKLILKLCKGNLKF